MTPPASSGPGSPLIVPPSDEVALERLAQIATELGAERLRSSIDAFRERMLEGRFFVACVGQFKRGKSTLINALVGQPVVPTGLLPVTAVPTIVQYGSAAGARVTFASGATEHIALDAVAGFVAASWDARHDRVVERVDVYVPSASLLNGLCLVDTPGLGSVFRADAAATRSFVPQIDVALVVIGADPPISGDELQLITDAARHAPHLIVVLNKADRFTAAECQEAMRFAREAIERALGRPIPSVLEVSAAERIAGEGQPRDWRRLVERLRGLSTSSEPGLLPDALARGVQRLGEQCQREIREASAALYRPIEESDLRAHSLLDAIGQLAHESLQLGFHMDRAIDDAARDSAARRRSFLERTVPRATAELREGLGRAGYRFGPARRRQALELARAIAHRYLAEWLDDERRQVDDLCTRMIDEFVADARSFLVPSPQLTELGVTDLSAGIEPPESVRGGGALPHVVIDEPAVLAPSAWRRCLQLLVSIAPRSRTLERDACRHVEAVCTRSAESVELELTRRAGESARQIKQSVHTALATAYETIDRAVTRARNVRAQGEAAYYSEVHRLTALRREVAALLDAVAGTS